ncbi:MAG TPA: hypothetical protein VIT83_02960 [Gammaproteobacteria bacterium]
MPWLPLRAMANDNLRALYHFVVSPGPGDNLDPGYLPPDHESSPPYVVFPALPAQ